MCFPKYSHPPPGPLITEPFCTSGGAEVAELGDCLLALSSVCSELNVSFSSPLYLLFRFLSSWLT